MELTWYHDDLMSNNLFTLKNVIEITENSKVLGPQNPPVATCPHIVQITSFPPSDPDVPWRIPFMHWLQQTENRKEQRVTKLIWAQLFMCFPFSLCPSIPLYFSCRVRITRWYWTHLLYKTDVRLDRLATNTHKHTANCMLRADIQGFNMSVPL